MFMDLKHMDSEQHKRYTGVGNEKILANLERLKRSGLPFVIRVPAIAGVNDGEENARSMAERLQRCAGLRYVEFLPYNTMAGAKYQMLNWTYKETFSPPSEETLDRLVALMESLGVPARCRRRI